jgi:hypothetical protein
VQFENCACACKLGCSAAVNARIVGRSVTCEHVPHKWCRIVAYCVTSSIALDAPHWAACAAPRMVPAVPCCTAYLHCTVLLCPVEHSGARAVPPTCTAFYCSVLCMTQLGRVRIPCCTVPPRCTGCTALSYAVLSLGGHCSLA